MSRRIAAGELELPPRAALLVDHRSAIRRGLDAPVSTRISRGRRAPRTARSLLGALLEEAVDVVRASERPYLELVGKRIERGNLAERIRHRTDGPRTAARRHAAIRAVYAELMDCLEQNEPWPG
jgi:hypothetical protein